MRITVNGEDRDLAATMTVSGLLDDLGLDARKIAVERNREIVQRTKFPQVTLEDGDQLEIVHFIGGGSGAVASIVGQSKPADGWSLPGYELQSRLIVGTGKYKDYEETAEAVDASGAEIVTVAVRRVNVMDAGQPMLTDFLDPKKIIYLPNTAGCFTDRKSVV